jgi:uncharacterized membrane protein
VTADRDVPQEKRDQAADRTVDDLRAALVESLAASRVRFLAVSAAPFDIEIFDKQAIETRLGSRSLVRAGRVALTCGFPASAR